MINRITIRNGLLIFFALGALFVGFGVYASTTNTIADGVYAYLEQFGGPAQTRMRTLTIAPGEALAWHNHPGIGAYSIVKEGTLTIEDGCGNETVYVAGQAFFEPPGQIHRGKNLGTVNVVTAQTFIVPIKTPYTIEVSRECTQPPPIVPVILGSGTALEDSPAGGSAEVTFRKLTTAPKNTGEWHYHPANVYSTVVSGTIKIEDGCGGIQSYKAGQAFENFGGRVHRAINDGIENAVQYNVFIRDEGKPLQRLTPNNERRCGPARSVDECEGNGWKAFNHPMSFATRGECIAYVNNRRKVTFLVPEDPIH